MLDKSLIRKINSGRCFVFVGSGLSCEMGYPSWHELAKLTYEELTDQGRVSDSKSYEKYLNEKKYPEFFRQVERDLKDNRDALVNLLKPLLTPIVRKQGVLYELISRWPFACYITTNYDDEIKNHLEKLNEHFVIIRNRQKDFYSWRDGVSHIIQKLHSDLNYPDEMILTSSDYRRIYIENSGQYFRDKLCDVFAMFDILIIGHSLSDPDIDYVLKLARRMRSPQHPIYMVAADFTKADEQELLEKYNIVLVQYSNPDGAHAELRRMLKTADRFIAPRHSFREITTTSSRPDEEIEAASAIFLYKRLRDVEAMDYLSPLILCGLYSTNNKRQLVGVIAGPRKAPMSSWRDRILSEFPAGFTVTFRLTSRSYATCQGRCGAVYQRQKPLVRTRSERGHRSGSPAGIPPGSRPRRVPAGLAGERLRNGPRCSAQDTRNDPAGSPQAAHVIRPGNHPNGRQVICF